MATDPNGLIGKNGDLPWSYPDELAHFRKTTDQQVMIMGYNTYISTPEKLLKNRFSIVFSTKSLPNQDNIIFVSNLEEFLALENLPLDKQYYMIGGAKIAKIFLENNLLSGFILTKIHKSYEGDCYFPLEMIDNWSRKLIKKTEDYSIFYYEKI